MDVQLWLSTYPTSTFVVDAGEDYQSINSDHHHRLHSNPSLQTLPSIPSLQSPISLESHPLILLSATSLHLITPLPADIGAFAVHHNLLYAASGHQVNVYDVNINFNLIDTFNNTTHDYSSSGSVKSITFLKNTVFTAHQDGKIRSWKLTNENKHKLIAELPTVKDRIFRSIFPSNYKKIRRHKKRLWIEHYDAVSGLCFSNQGYLISVSWDRSLKIWRETDYRCIQSISKAHEDAINAVIVSSDGVIYTASADRLIKVWGLGKDDKRSYSLMGTLEKHRSAVNALALSGDESVLFSGACDRSILVWEKDGGGGGSYMRVNGALRGHMGAVLCLISVRDVLISGSEDRTVRVWRRGFDDGKYCCLSVLDGHEKAVRSVAATTAEEGCDEGGGLKVISGSSGGVIKAWQIVFSTCH
ncbi:protein JINGUBANG-like [Impatiens glandulifera]|uniref:protein JINGUBANG-like n=1 Tax=Impatiens glandulifera TaxID=253017 RepID=UPI001FB07624|nr:protein JINGUBANG-like [Impatiens glandulifera]